MAALTRRRNIAHLEVTGILQDLDFYAARAVLDPPGSSQMADHIASRARCGSGVELGLPLDLREERSWRIGEEVRVTQKGKAATMRQGEDDGGYTG